MGIMENQVKHKYLWILGLIRVNTNEHVSGEKKGHLESAGVAGMTLVMRCPSPPMSGCHIVNRFPTTAKNERRHLPSLLSPPFLHRCEQLHQKFAPFPC